MLLTPDRDLWYQPKWKGTIEILLFRPPFWNFYKIRFRQVSCNSHFGRALDWRSNADTSSREGETVRDVVPIQEQMYNLWTSFISKNSGHVFHYFLTAKYSHSCRSLFFTRVTSKMLRNLCCVLGK